MFQYQRERGVVPVPEGGRGPLVVPRTADFLVLYIYFVYF